MKMSSVPMGARLGAKALAVPAVAGLLLTLAACGGGSSTGGLPLPPPPPVCNATTGGGDGYALGVCASSVTAAFQAIGVAVQPSDAPSYLLTLDFPAALPAGLSTSVGFTSANRTPVGTRDVVGELRGIAYEDDADAATDPDNLTLKAPYTALIDFRKAWNYGQVLPDDGNTQQTMVYAGFGVWERFGTASFDDGYFGSWYSGWTAPDLTTDWPAGARSYTGVAVGVISPSDPVSAAALPQPRSYGFSATVTIEVDATGKILESSRLSDLKVVTSGTGTNLTIQGIPLDPVAFVWGASNFLNGPLSGSLLGTGGPAADSQGAFEASFYGSNAASGEAGVEMAGHFRFQTSNGLRAVGAFGAVRVTGP